MSHNSVRTLLSDVAKSLADNIQTGYGRRSEFNMIERKCYPYIWILPLQASRRLSTSNTKTKTWNCAIVFLSDDTVGANEKESAKILDEMDILVDKYLNQLDFWYLRMQDDMGVITLQNDNQIPFLQE